jgi:hypothetical protein
MTEKLLPGMIEGERVLRAELLLHAGQSENRVRAGILGRFRFNWAKLNHKSPSRPKEGKRRNQLAAHLHP